MIVPAQASEEDAGGQSHFRRPTPTNADQRFASVPGRCPVGARENWDSPPTSTVVATASRQSSMEMSEVRCPGGCIPRQTGNNTGFTRLPTAKERTP